MGENGDLIPPKDKNDLLSQIESDVSSVIGDFQCEEIVPNDQDYSKSEKRLFCMLNNVLGFVKNFIGKQEEREAEMLERRGNGGSPMGEEGYSRGDGQSLTERDREFESRDSDRREGSMRASESHPSYSATVDKQGTNSWMVKENSNLLKDINRLRTRMRFVESESDECRQRQWKGVFKLTSPKFKRGPKGVRTNIDSLFVDMPAMKEGEEEDEAISKETLEKMLELVQQKYEVNIPLKEVTAAHWLPSGDFLISLQYRNPVLSTFGSLVKAIKKGGDTDMNFYVNFCLTPMRQGLFAYVRNLKFIKKIEQYKVNENGRISIRIKGKWLKLTHHYDESGKAIPTYERNELDKVILNN